ncbi:MAG: hypothetical protein GXO77_14320 [Calditrichaeota bacterium]|nr:hypothetical protein [Calditrichota bacterium]
MLNKNWFILLVLILFANGFSRNSAEQALKVQQLYESLQFEKAIDLSRDLLKSNIKFSPKDLILIHQFAGYSFFNLGQPDSAKKYFLTILTIDPDYQFDPVNTSPKIIKFFNRIKQNYRNQTLNAAPIPYTRYVFLEDLRPGASWRSAVLPGWGQYYKNQKQKAKWMGGAFLTSAGFSLISLYLENHYHQKYLNSVKQQDISRNYDRYNLWYKTRRVSSYITASVWLASVLDALWTPYQTGQYSFSVNGKSGEAALSFHLRF